MKESYGVQIYGAMRLFRNDSDGFLGRLRNAGYTQVEPCVAFGMTAEDLNNAGMNPVWLPEEVERFRTLTEKHGLEITTCHVFGDPEVFGDKMKEMAVKNNISALVLGGAPFAGENVNRYARRCLDFAELLEEADISLWLHNNYPEIENKCGEVSQYEAVLQSCGGKVGAQPDVGWVLYGGEAVIPFLQRIRPYLRSIHYKDIRGGRSECTPEEHPICLGKGKLDLDPIVKLAKELKLPQVIDQDDSFGDFMKDLEDSVKLLKESS